jgi:hypothetical protein
MSTKDTFHSKLFNEDYPVKLDVVETKTGLRSIANPFPPQERSQRVTITYKGWEHTTDDLAEQREQEEAMIDFIAKDAQESLAELCEYGIVEIIGSVQSARGKSNALNIVFVANTVEGYEGNTAVINMAVKRN